jgi:[calcium/calmodulin-dependent protein kinase] kinase
MSRDCRYYKLIRSPYIQLVLLYEAINVNTSDSLYLVLEYVPGGTLMDIKVGGKPSKSLEKEKARSYFRQLTLGLEYLHSAGVTHRDIKVRRIFPDWGENHS